jgi:hypothetical protein
MTWDGLTVPYREDLTGLADLSNGGWLRRVVHVVDKMGPGFDFGQLAGRIQRCLLQQRVGLILWKFVQRGQRVPTALKKFRDESPFQLS